MPTNPDGTSHFGSCTVYLEQKRAEQGPEIVHPCPDHPTAGILLRRSHGSPHYGEAVCPSCSRWLKWLRKPV